MGIECALRLLEPGGRADFVMDPTNNSFLWQFFPALRIRHLLDHWKAQR